jgi:hypothetical protein
MRNSYLTISTDVAEKYITRLAKLAPVVQRN